MWTTIVIIVFAGLLLNQYMKNKRLNAKTHEDYGEVHAGHDHDQHTSVSGKTSSSKSSHRGHGCC